MNFKDEYEDFLNQQDLKRSLTMGMPAYSEAQKMSEKEIADINAIEEKYHRGEVLTEEELEIYLDAHAVKVEVV
jgi:hypothetical protein